MSNDTFKVKKGLTLTPVDPSTLVSPQAGDIVCDSTDSNNIKRYNAVTSSWDVVGGTGGTGSLDTLTQQSFEAPAALSDFTYTTGFSLSSTTADLIHGSVTGKITHDTTAGTARYVRQTVAVDEKFRGKNVVATIYVRSNATAGNVQFNVYDNTNAANIVASEQLTLDADLSVRNLVSFAIPDTCESLYWGVTCTAETSAVTYIDDICIEIGSTPLLETSIDVPVMTAWTSFTPTGGWTGTVAYTGKYRQVGENLEVQVSVATSGAPTGSALSINLPSGYTIDTAKMGNSSPTGTGTGIFGVGMAMDAGVNAYPICATYNNTSSIYIAAYNAASTNASRSTVIPTVPFTFGSGDTVDITFTVPCVGLEATETVEIPLAQSGLIQEDDTFLRLTTTAATFGTTNTSVRRFVTTQETRGSAITWTDSATLGSYFTAQVSGIYSVVYFENSTVSSRELNLFLSKNDPTGATTASVLSETRNIYNTATADNKYQNVAWTGYLAAGDILYAGSFTPASINGALAGISIAYQGKLKQANVIENQKAPIPTSYLRFEGASSRGAVATSIIKFDTITKLVGNAFTITSDSNNGTYITMTKAGKLDVSCSLYGVSSSYKYISKNQSTLTTTPSASEILASAGTTAANNMAATTYVAVGDIIRVCTSANVTADSLNCLNLTFQETEVQVSVSNTLPQFSESDSCVRVDTANGFGSTNTLVRRFSNNSLNLGSNIVYADSVTLGSSFTVTETGIYSITYNESITTASANMGIVKNQTTLVDTSDDLARERHSGTAGEEILNASWTGYLSAGDIIRPISTAAAFSNTRVSFTMAKIGRPQVTGVDVTPFVKQSLQTTQTATSSGSGTYTGGVVSLAPTITTGSGIFSYSAGVFTALKKCRVNIVCSARNNAAATMLISASISSNSAAMRSNSVAAAGNYATASDTGVLLPGQTFSFQVETGTADIFRYDVVAVAEADSIVTEVESFSTDTNALTYAGSASYTISTLANAPVGTFITYTTAASTNTNTQTTTPPTQTVSDMNTNGILVYCRNYGIASTSTQPAYVAIQIGKGMKGVSINAYKSASKTTPVSLEGYLGAGDTSWIGMRIRTYDENTGVLILNLGSVPSSSTSSVLLASDNTSATSAYFTINASKNPALTGVQITPRVGANYTSTGGGAVGTSATLLTYETKVYDSHNAYTGGVYTVPETGLYSISANFLSGTTLWTTTSGISAIVYVNGVEVARNFVRIGVAHSTSYEVIYSGHIYLAKGQTVSIYGQSNVATSMTTATGYNNFSIFKVGS
jgi:hypothetical protein